MNPPSSPLNASVIGLGIGEQHAAMYARLPHTRLRWLYDISAEKAADVRARVGHGQIAPNYDSILADVETAVVSIASYDHLHHQEVLAALAAGKHVFVEKPLCRTVSEVAAVKAAWATAGEPHLRSNLVLRAAPVYRWLRSAIEDGLLGTVYAVDGDYLYGRLHKITEGWRRDVPDYSVMEGGGIHMVDLMMTMCGERPVRAASVGTDLCTRGTGFRHADFMATTFEFPSGVIGRITANFGCVHRHHHVLRVFGTEATFIYDDAGPRLHKTRDEDSNATPIDLETLPRHKGDLIPDFVDAILSGRDAEPEAQREFNLVCAVAAADRAFAAGQPQDIEYV